MAERPFLVRAVWFVFIGWWVTPVVVNVAWLLNVTIILLPLGIKLINLVPTVLTLAEPRALDESTPSNQESLLVRAVYFVFVGWWLSLLWANAAAFFAATIIGLPLGIWMAHRLPFVTSLYRFHG